jgi:hypothetical protein
MMDQPGFHIGELKSQAGGRLVWLAELPSTWLGHVFIAADDEVDADPEMRTATGYAVIEDIPLLDQPLFVFDCPAGNTRFDRLQRSEPGQFVLHELAARATATGNMLHIHTCAGDTVSLAVGSTRHQDASNTRSEGLLT